MSDKESPARRYCTSCQSWRLEAGGQAHKRAHITRWICLSCNEKRTVSRYASKATLAKINQEGNQNAEPAKSNLP